jgi:amidophosphoribosyltransferase
MIKNAGAKETHFRVSSPPTIRPCFYGIDTPKRDELIASSHTIEEIARHLDADSLGYLSHEGLMASVGPTPHRFCSACFTDNYPVPFPTESREQMKLFEKVRD